MPNRNIPQQPSQGNMIMASGDTSFVSAEMLKQVSVPVETLLGATNGALSGALFSAGASALYTFAQQEGQSGGLLKAAAKNLTGSHKVAALLGTTALATLGGIVRYSRAVKHNEWSERHYAHMEQQQQQQAPQPTSFVAREQARDETREMDQVVAR